jgi:hypothetical protein
VETVVLLYSLHRHGRARRFVFDSLLAGTFSPIDNAKVWSTNDVVHESPSSVFDGDFSGNDFARSGIGSTVCV